MCNGLIALTLPAIRTGLLPWSHGIRSTSETAINDHVMNSLTRFQVGGLEGFTSVCFQKEASLAVTPSLSPEMISGPAYLANDQ